MTEPQFSPDGQWWWDGTQWVPASQAPQPPPAAPEPQQPQAAPAAWPPVASGQVRDQVPPAPDQVPGAAPAQAAGAPPYGQPYAYPTQPLYGAPEPSTAGKGKGVASLVCALVPACGITSIVAVILGHLSRSEARKDGRPASGLSTAGLILGYLGIVGWVLVIAAVATHKNDIKNTFDASVELQSAADAEHSYHDSNGTYTEELSALKAFGYVNINDSTDVDVISATSTSFCLHAKVFGEDQYMSDGNRRPTRTPCG